MDLTKKVRWRWITKQNKILSLECPNFPWKKESLESCSNWWFSSKKLWMVMSQFLFLHQKKWDIIRETKNSSFSSVVVLTKTERSSKGVVGNFERRMPHYSCTHNSKIVVSCKKTFFCVQRIDKNKVVKPSFGRSHAMTKKSKNCVNLILKLLNCLSLVKNIASYIC